nr:hypothetical protein BaRGS_032245 [Batillaria attramentaria]
MWEETRRWYLQFLVEEKLWDIVKELADHSLYDDQRGWALGQALYDKQWDVMVVLADHGLTDEQLRKVYRLVAKHADWHTVRQLFERGVDMRVVCEELMAANPSRERPPSRERIERLRNMGEDVTLMEADQWILVARVMELSLDDTERRRVMQAALDKKEGSVVAHGISVMEGRLSVEEREVMYDQALSQGVWQAVKRLVEEKDDTGMTQSDKALAGLWDSMRYIVARGGNPLAVTDGGKTVLTVAVEYDRRYQRRVKQLPLPDPMKSYVMFSELVDPDYGKDMVLLEEKETEQEKMKQGKQRRKVTMKFVTFV